MSMTLTYSDRNALKKVLPVIAIAVAMLAIAGFVFFSAVKNADAARPSDYGLTEGNTVSATGSDDPDVYIVNDAGYKRLFLNPVIFNMYGHLGGFANVKTISAATRDAFPTSGLFRNCETNDEKVYGVATTGEDTGMLHWVNTTGAQAVTDDPNFFQKVFCINSNEFNWYSKGSDYTSVSQVPNYVRVPGSTPIPSGALTVSLASDNPAAKTITRNAIGVEYLKVRFSGTGTVNQVTLKRLGAGLVADFANVYVYDGATRLVSGKTFSSSSGEVTFINLGISVSGTKDITFVGEMTAATAGDVNYIQLKDVVLSSGTVSGLPINGNNMTVSGASSGTVTITRTGSIGNPNVGAKNVQLSEFKLTTATEGASIKRLTLIQGGSVKAADITNLKLKSGTSEWSGSMTSTGYAVFDLGSGFTIAKGGNAIFSMYGDVAGKKSETIGFYFENDTDTLAVGDQYGQGMAVTDTNFDELDTTNNDEAHYLVLAGGVLTLNFVGPSAGNIGTDTSDTTFLRYSMTSAANIEIRKTRVTLCNDYAGDGTFNSQTAALTFPDLEDVKIVNEDTGAIIVGPADGTAFATLHSAACPDSADGVYKEFTDTFDMTEGQTLNLKITADVKTTNSTTTTVEDIASGSKVVVVLTGYGDLAGNIANIKYSGTTTAVAATDIAPSTDITGPEMTVQASALTLGLAGTPGDQTYVKGTTNVDMVGITFNAAQASDLKVTSITITGYMDESASNATYNKGDDLEDTTMNIANAVTNIRLVEGETGVQIAGSAQVANNSLSVADTGTMKFSFTSTPWTIPAGATKTMLVRVDLTNNAVSGTYDYYMFDIDATTDVTALDSSNNTVNAAAGDPNGGTVPTTVLTVASTGSLTVSQSPSSPNKAAIYWGQTNVPISAFRFTSSNEAQYIEKMTIAATSSLEAVDANANVKKVRLSYKNKAGTTLTSEQSFTTGASANFGFTGDNRPYVPKNSSLDITVYADMRTGDEGATQDVSSTHGPVADGASFSLDFSDTYSGSTANGFKSVGEGSGTVLDGASTGVGDILGKNNMVVWRVYPKFDSIALSAPYTLIGTPDVLKFSITAMGTPDAKLFFDNQDTTNFYSGSIKFEIVASGEYIGNTNASSAFTVYDEAGTIIDTMVALHDVHPSPHASMTMDFGGSGTGQDVEITGGQSKTFRVQFTNPSNKYALTSTTGRAADYFQLSLLDDENGLITWVGNSTGSTADKDSQSITNYVKNLPIYGPTFTR